LNPLRLALVPVAIEINSGRTFRRFGFAS